MKSSFVTHLSCENRRSEVILSPQRRNNLTKISHRLARCDKFEQVPDLTVGKGPNHSPEHNDGWVLNRVRGTIVCVEHQVVDVDRSVGAGEDDLEF